MIADDIPYCVVMPDGHTEAGTVSSYLGPLIQISGPGHGFGILIENESALSGNDLGPLGTVLHRSAVVCRPAILVAGFARSLLPIAGVQASFFNGDPLSGSLKI